MNSVTIDDPGAFSKPFTVTFLARLQAPGDDIMEHFSPRITSTASPAGTPVRSPSSAGHKAQGSTFVARAAFVVVLMVRAGSPVSAQWSSQDRDRRLLAHAAAGRSGGDLALIRSMNAGRPEGSLYGAVIPSNQIEAVFDDAPVYSVALRVGGGRYEQKTTGGRYEVHSLRPGSYD